MILFRSDYTFQIVIDDPNLIIRTQQMIEQETDQLYFVSRYPEYGDATKCLNF